MFLSNINIYYIWMDAENINNNLWSSLQILSQMQQYHYGKVRWKVQRDCINKRIRMVYQNSKIKNLPSSMADNYRINTLIYKCLLQIRGN